MKNPRWYNNSHIPRLDQKAQDFWRIPMEWQHWLCPCSHFQFLIKSWNLLRKISGTLNPEASIPLRPWCISPLFQISPYFSKKFRTLKKIFAIWLFPRKISWFSYTKISDDLFLVIDHIFRISPLFSLFQYISPLFRENYFFPLLLQIFPPILGTCFLHTLRVFSPYFDNDVFMHHPMHVLDAPESESG